MTPARRIHLKECALPIARWRAARFRTVTLFIIGGLAVINPHALSQEAFQTNYVAGRLIELNDNGAWSWFMDERAIVDRGKLIVGSVRAVGTFRSGKDDPDWGNVEVSVLEINSGVTRRTVLHRHFEQDDHDNPAFLRL